MRFIKCKNSSGHDVYINLQNIEVIQHIPNYVIQIFCMGPDEPVVLDIPSTQRMIDFLETSDGYLDISTE
ncbi:MAG: hypothetical protein WDA09_02690 [Bacteriovoracaceae bacterium]